MHTNTTPHYTAHKKCTRLAVMHRLSRLSQLLSAARHSPAGKHCCAEHLARHSELSQPNFISIPLSLSSFLYQSVGRRVEWGSARSGGEAERRRRGGGD